MEPGILGASPRCIIIFVYDLGKYLSCSGPQEPNLQNRNISTPYLFHRGTDEN